MFEKDLSLSLLYDVYSPLLSEKKREAFEGYYLSDLSLSEIAQDTGTSRQAVRDLISRTCSELREYEVKLGLLKKRGELAALCEKAKNVGCSDEILEQIREII
jgi:predicted DNA-binding protein YlxM (UPF0122 family)